MSEQTVAPEAPHITPAPAAGGNVALYVLLAIGWLSLLGFGVYVLRPTAPAPADNKELATLAATQLTAMEKQIAMLQQQLQTIGTVMDKNQQMMEALNSLSNAIPAAGKVEEPLPSKENSTAINREIEDVHSRTASLEEKMDTLQQSMQSLKQVQNAQQLLLAAVHLRDAVRTSARFDREVQAIKLLGRDMPDMTKNAALLEPYATTGIAPLETLQQEFNILAGNITATSRQEKANPTMLDKAALYFPSIISIRKIGSNKATGDTAEDILSRAEYALGQNHIQTALTEVAKLQGNAATLIAPWQAKAQAYIESITASEAIFDAAAQLSSGQPHTGT